MNVLPFQKSSQWFMQLPSVELDILQNSLRRSSKMLQKK